MKTTDGFSQNLQNALNNGVLKRLPVTFLPFVNEQLQKWQYLFPNEQHSVQGLLLYVDSLSVQQYSALFRNVIQLEEKMDVRHWQLSTTEQTIQNSSELARSPYFLEWRRAVQAVYDAVDQHAPQPKTSQAKRLILLDIPLPLPLNPTTAWHRWQGIGKPLNLEMDGSEDSACPFDFLLNSMFSQDSNASKAIRSNAERVEVSCADTWIIDAGSSRSKVVPMHTLEHNSILLSYQRLTAYRENFSHEMNTMRKDLVDADAVFDHLRRVDVTQWSPPEVAADPAVREFVRSLYLTGNGAVIFANSFVEWGASEAFRRARPSFLAARFGVRAKPKPFTGVAVFDNPDQVNPAPSVDDLSGSAADAEILALYIWLAAQRYPEYQQSTVCVCLAESISQAYIVAPPEFIATLNATGAKLPELSAALATWLS